MSITNLSQADTSNWLLGVAALIWALTGFLKVIHKIMKDWPKRAKARTNPKPCPTQSANPSRWRRVELWLALATALFSMGAIAFILWITWVATDEPLTLKWAAVLALLTIFCSTSSRR